MTRIQWCPEDLCPADFQRPHVCIPLLVLALFALLPLGLRKLSVALALEPAARSFPGQSLFFLVQAGSAVLATYLFWKRYPRALATEGIGRRSWIGGLGAAALFLSSVGLMSLLAATAQFRLWYGALVVQRASLETVRPLLQQLDSVWEKVQLCCRTFSIERRRLGVGYSMMTRSLAERPKV